MNENIMYVVIVQEEVKRLVRGQSDENVDFRVHEQARLELVLRHAFDEFAIFSWPM